MAKTKTTIAKKATRPANPYGVETLGIKTIDKVIDVCEPIGELMLYPSALALRLWTKELADAFCDALGIEHIAKYQNFKRVVTDFFASAEEYTIDMAIACQAQRQMRIERAAHAGAASSQD